MGPANAEEYEKRFHENTHYEGFGTETTMVTPCPFCAAPNFSKTNPFQGVLPGDDRPDIDTQMGTEATCSECGRSGRWLIERGRDGVSAEFVQTGGDPPPEWLTPPPRWELTKE